jgi:hypothetical protein
MADFSNQLTPPLQQKDLQGIHKVVTGSPT